MTVCAASFGVSHPTGVRGLKCVSVDFIEVSVESHPTGVRGLKSVPGIPYPPCFVAPHWGAWIEIILLVEVQHDSRSHPTGVRGLKYEIA